jgi:hypothetical protein
MEEYDIYQDKQQILNARFEFKLARDRLTNIIENLNNHLNKKEKV